jgi:integrase
LAELTVEAEPKPERDIEKRHCYKTLRLVLFCAYLAYTPISELLDAGADVLTVSKLAGHADPATTQKYDLRGEEAKRKAVQLLQIPYLGNS